MVHIFKGIPDTFESFEWNFRDIGIRRFLDFGVTCTNYYTILRILSKYFQGYGILGTPLPGPQLL